MRVDLRRHEVDIATLAHVFYVIVDSEWLKIKVILGEYVLLLGQHCLLKKLTFFVELQDVCVFVELWDALHDNEAL